MAVDAVTSASSLQTDYLKLLVTQLQNQNPLEPMSTYEMSSQLTQLAQLAQTESMNTSFADVLATTEQNYATSLIGKTVTFVGTATDGTAEIQSGVVDQVLTDTDGAIVLGIGESALYLSDVVSVKATE